VKSIIELILRTVNLLEAEGRLLREQIVRLSAAVVAVALLGFATLAAVIGLAAALFLALLNVAPPAIALLIAAAALLIVAIVSGLVVMAAMNRRSP
jgi:ABC-type polysaccharide/polyol phosphate export permease